MTALPRIFCAIDTNDIDIAIKLSSDVKDYCGIKLGLEFFNGHGIQGVKRIEDAIGDTPIFLDLKYHDIPNTVAGAIRALTNQISPAFLNVHASGGLEMMKAAKSECPESSKLLAVTVLTSTDTSCLQSVGQGQDIDSQVKKLALLTQEAGLDGVVCSSHEIQLIRETCGNDFITMVPGIRPTNSGNHDQKRVMTPEDAIKLGATHLVIGRPITRAENPVAMARSLFENLSQN